MNSDRVPFNAVIAMSVLALLITLPALKGNSAGDPFPWAFFAVVSVTVIGLYIAYVIPIYLRWRAGDRVRAGPWTLGNKYKWMNPFAVFWVGLITIIFCLPFTPAAVPWRKGFDWQAFNYAPVTVVASCWSVPGDLAGRSAPTSTSRARSGRWMHDRRRAVDPGVRRCAGAAGAGRVTAATLRR